MKYLRRWVWVFVLLATAALAEVPDWSVQQVRLTQATAVFNRLRGQIQQKGSAAAKALDRQVTLIVDTSGAPEPRSTIDYNGRKVVVPDAFFAKTVNVARLLQLARGAGDLECVETYKAHMENTGSRTGPEGYLDLAVSICETFKARLPLNQEQELRAQRELEATLIFAYLHELGHQYHNHQRVPMPSNVETKENQCAFLRMRNLRRQMEYEADSFAVDMLVHLGQVGLLLSTTNLWMPPPLEPDPAQMASNGMLAQRLAGHPYSPFRFVRILDQASEALSGRAGTGAQTLQIIREMIEVERRATALIAENDAELNPC